MTRKPSRWLFTVIAMAFVSAEIHAADITGKITIPRTQDNSDAVIWIDKIPGKTFTPPRMPVPLDQFNLKFVPHVLQVLVGTTVAFPNTDVVRHNVFSPTRKEISLGTYRVGETRYQIFDKPGVVTLLCNIHAEMSAFVIVTETPYADKSDAAGNYTIRNVPPGRYVLRVWSEKAKPQTREIEVFAGDLKNINFELRR